MKEPSADPREAFWRQPAAGQPAPRPGSPDGQLEVALTQALARLPDAPVASNFTVRVLAAVDREDARGTRPGQVRFFWQVLFPRATVAATLLLVAVLSFQHYAERAEREHLVRTVAAATLAQPVPSTDALENLDAIQHLGETSHADTELLAALQ